MKLLLLLTALLITHSGATLWGQSDSPRKTYKTQRLIGSPPVIDGYINDSAWQQGVWGGGFVQYEPFENAEPAFETEFKILYDDNNLFIAFKAHDSAPDSIEKRLSRRDDGQGDLVAIQFDSYFDQRTGFTFAVTAAGVKVDYITLNDGESQDNVWDPVWEAKTSLTNFGWVAEVTIPFNQLRFGNQNDHIWGLQVARHTFRRNETSLWQPIPRAAGGWVSLIGEIHGISGIRPKKQFDAIPYFVAQYETFKQEPDNPFRTGDKHMLNAGLDAKIGLTNDLTLDLTFNPDFGQVEADPSQINLTAFETFFEEKRPFFIEGRNIMSYPLQSNGHDNNDNLFYSRRIGRQPQFYPDLNANQHIKQPINTTILGAAKLTGKTRRGLSVGIMQSVTADEYATIDTDGIRDRIHVEPATNYFAARVGQDFNRGNTTLGGMFTA
ncbi:MAG TPA: DUF5916 domain-containing protein, partial [Bacteroidales bacterium]|nr:DUF5916 domain-containing protein [Bacteroidales bacterium]